MTDTPKKKRNPRELPISEAIEKLRSLYAERDAELEKVVEHATKKVYEQFGKRFERVIVRVPVDLHAHVQERAKAKQKKNGTTPESDEGQGAAYKSEGYGFNEPGSDEPHPDWLDAPAPRKWHGVFAGFGEDSDVVEMYDACTGTNQRRGKERETR